MFKNTDSLWPDGLRDAFNQDLMTCLESAADDSDFAAMAHYACTGGKQVRPGLLFAVGSAYSLDYHRMLPYMLGIELIHSYSLVHDDLPAMDNDLVRHGKPSLHAKYGQAMAILVGDFLLNLAYEIVISAIDSKAQQEAARRLAFAGGARGMIGGQYCDLSIKLDSLEDISSLDRIKLLSQLEKIQELKTGALLEACILIPLDLAVAPQADYAIWRAYARDLGKAYQIKDDILDYTSSFDRLGKSVGKDERDAKLTSCRIQGLKGAQRSYQMLSESVELNLDKIMHLPGIKPGLVKAWTEFILGRSF